jgi:hypothetical protein
MWASVALAQDAPPTADGGAPERPNADPPALPSVGVELAGANGFALGADKRSRLHLGLDAGAGFDTNPFSVAAEQPGGVDGALALRIRPRTTLQVPGHTVAFTSNAMIDFGFLPGQVGRDGNALPLLYQSNVGADVEVNRGGALRFAVGDTFSWNSDPGVATVGVIFNRLRNSARAAVGARPGGGALELKLGTGFDFVKYFDDENTGGAIAAGDLDSVLLNLTLRTDYKFLPRTGVFNTLSIGWSNPFSASARKPESFPLTVLLGIQGQILSKVSGLASLGYANPLIIQDGVLVTTDVLGVVGQIELQWAPSPSTGFGGGFQSSISPSPLYQFVGNNRFYASLSQLVGARFSLAVNAGYSILAFGDEITPLSTQPTGRLDGHLDAVAGLTYFFTDWLSLGITDKLDWRITNAEEISVDGTAGANYGFLRNQTFMLASVTY